MHQNAYYRQEYINLLRIHAQEISTISASLQEQRKALKVLQNQEINAASSGLEMLKRIFLKMKHIREMRALNDSMEASLSALRSAQQEEIYNLKMSWQLRHSLNEAG
jgi:hypothetical protein